MNSNRVVLIIIALMSFMLSLPKLKQESLTMILITIAIGYSVTKNMLSATCIAFILGAVFVSLTSIKPTQSRIEHFKVEGKKKKKKKKKKNESFDVGNNNEDDGDDDEEFLIDSKGSFFENYKSLSKTQMKGLNNDTKELMSVQKELMDTLQNMKEPLKNGKQILDTFKNYFGSDDVGALTKKLNF